MNLPGLNIDAEKYPLTWQGSDKFRVIPFADWLPPDFEDVLCSRGGGFKMMYFSPATGMMVPSDTEYAGEALHPTDLKEWLKKLS